MLICGHQYIGHSGTAGKHYIHAKSRVEQHMHSAGRYYLILLPIHAGGCVSKWYKLQMIAAALLLSGQLE